MSAAPTTEEQDGAQGLQQGLERYPRRAARARAVGAAARHVARRPPVLVPGVAARPRAAARRLRRAWSTRAASGSARSSSSSSRRPAAPSSTVPGERRTRRSARGHHDPARARRGRRARGRRSAVPRRDRAPCDLRTRSAPGRSAAAGRGAVLEIGELALAPGVAVRARRRRLRPSHVPLRPVGVGQDVLARRRPRAAAGRDGAADRRARSRTPTSCAWRRSGTAPTRLPRSATARSRARIAVHSARAEGERRLRMRLGELEPAAQAALLRLDPIADREEHAELVELLVRGPAADASRRWSPRRGPGARRLALRARNLGVERLRRVGGRARRARRSTRSTTRRRAASSSTSARSPRREEQALTAAAVLGELWQRREERKPGPDRHRRGPQRLPRQAGGPADRARHRARRADRRGGPQVRPLPAGLDAAAAEGARERHLAVRQPRADAAQLGRRRRVRAGRVLVRAAAPGRAGDDVPARRGARGRQDLAASRARALRRADRRGGRLGRARRPGAEDDRAGARLQDRDLALGVAVAGARDRPRRRAASRSCRPAWRCARRSSVRRCGAARTTSRTRGGSRAHARSPV